MKFDKNKLEERLLELIKEREESKVRENKTQMGNEITWEKVLSCTNYTYSGIDERKKSFVLKFKIPPLPISHNFEEHKHMNSRISNAKCKCCGLRIGLFITDIEPINEEGVEFGHAVWQETKKIKDYSSIDRFGLVRLCSEVRLMGE